MFMSFNMKQLKLYFKRGSTLLSLNKFPKSYALIIANWNVIVKTYMENNTDYYNENDKVKKIVKSFFPTIPKMTLETKHFNELKKDLKIDDNIINIYVNGTNSRLVELSERKEDI